MRKADFYLNKWYLDFIGNDGETMIFYSAKLSFKGIVVHYSSWISYDSENGVNEISHFRNVKLPEKKEKLITWRDEKFKVSGCWESVSTPLQARIFEADDGYLDWNCFQPASNAQVKTNDKIIEGKGYVEQLILTIPPWYIPMNDLRWGRFRSQTETMVWIELRKENKQQWLWLNGEKITNAVIEDDHIASQEKDFFLKLNREAVLESEKKIFHVAEKLQRFLPGFNKLMPAKFLMATNHKWLSVGEFRQKKQPVSRGMAIHEWVNFNPRE